MRYEHILHGQSGAAPHAVTTTLTNAVMPAIIMRIYRKFGTIEHSATRKTNSEQTHTRGGVAERSSEGSGCVSHAFELAIFAGA